MATKVTEALQEQSVQRKGSKALTPCDTYLGCCFLF